MDFCLTGQSLSECGNHAFKTQLLKWVGNKQRFASEIISYFPQDYGTYYEPFLGSGAVMATLCPKRGVGSDIFAPLMEIWFKLKEDPETLKHWYRENWELCQKVGKKVGYEQIKDRYNNSPNGKDLLYLCRSCYGGVVRFRKKDGFLSTPCGPHTPIHPDSFDQRVDIWSNRFLNVTVKNVGYQEIFKTAKKGDLIYCDPPYSHSQSILYGGQDFSLDELLDEIARAKSKGVFVALSIDGSKKSGYVECNLPIPKGLFEREVWVNVGHSMLRRFQLEGQTLRHEQVQDRLLLTY